MIGSVVIVSLFRFINKKYEPPIFGIYQKRNKTYWFKFLFMYIFLRLRQLVTYLKRLLAIELGRSPDGIAHVQEHDFQLERLYDLGTRSKAVDGVYFNGMSKGGDAIICGLARRPNRICDSFLYLKINGQDLFLSPSLPDTYLQKSEDDGDGYSAKGINITNFIPMRAWILHYNGEMKSRSNSNKTVLVDANLTWSALWAPFEYDSQMSPRSVADDMAREPWSRDYFKVVKKLHQTHYEQMGFIAGTVSIDGKNFELNMPCVRDRSFGQPVALMTSQNLPPVRKAVSAEKNRQETQQLLFSGPLRDWRSFHRYVYHFIFLDNGDCMAVGSVSQPSILSHLTIGYLCRKADQTVVPVDYSDFHLYRHAEHQILPKHYGFIFRAGGQSYAVRVCVNEEEMFYIGKDREAKFYERWCDVEINGVKGRACVEWHYNNTLSKLFNK